VFRLKGEFERVKKSGFEVKVYEFRLRERWWEMKKKIMKVCKWCDRYNW